MGFVKQIFKRRPGDVAKEEKELKELEDLKTVVATLQKDFLNKVKSPTDKEEVTSAIQYLIVYYLKIHQNPFFKGLKNGKIAIVLSVLFKLKDSENIRQRLSSKF